MAFSIDIISCITDRFVELTATEKRIAQFILDDVQFASTLPIAEMAHLTGTSQASVTRFARAIGCKDVRELKVKLAQSLAVGQRFILDVPDLDGVQVCRKLRERTDAAIIVVTAHGEEPDRVMALDAGGSRFSGMPDSV